MISDLSTDSQKKEHPASNAEQRYHAEFENVALPHLDAAYSLARWLTHNEAHAGDVVQEAFMQALRHFGSYRGGDAKIWVLKIVRQTCYGWLAGNRAANVASLTAEVELGCEVATASINANAVLEDRSDLRRLHQLIKALPAPLRETIILREVHELRYSEITEITGVPIGTIMSRLYRARSEVLRASAQTTTVSAA